MVEIISIIANLILGSGLMGVVLFYRAKRRKEAAEATHAEMENKQVEFEIHRQSVEFLSGQLTEAYCEVGKLQDIVNAKRDDIIELIRRTKQFEIELIEKDSLRRKAELAACYRIDCLERREVVQ